MKTGLFKTFSLTGLFWVVSVSLYAQTITTVAGGATGHGGYWGDGGPATAAQIGVFGGLAIDDSGNIYIADANNERIRKVDATTGIINTIAGTGIAGYNGDNIPATSVQFNYPTAVCLDKENNIYIGDAYNYRIRKIDAVTGIITTFAGNGINGFYGDNGPATAAEINGGPFTFDVFGNFYIEDGRNFRVRKIDTAGIITTIAGTGIWGHSGDGGPALSATVNEIAIGICTDVSGNVYLPDSSCSIRKINVSTGIITRVAGTGDNIGIPYSGDGSIDTLCHIYPVAVAVDGVGNLYTADFENQRIEKIDTFGIVYSIAGTGTSGFSGDNGPAISAKISYPENVVLDKCGNLYIADFNNARVRKVAFNPACWPEAIENTTKPVIVNMYPNPTYSTITITAPLHIHTVTISNMMGQQVYTQSYDVDKAEIDISALPQGMYVVRVNNTYVQKLVKE